MGLAEVADHHRVARIDHIGHPVVHPEGRLVAKLGAGVVFLTEAVRHLGDAAVERHVGHHIGIVAVEPGDAAHVVGQPRAHLARHSEARLLAGDRPFTEVSQAVAVLEVHRQGTDGHAPWTGCHIGGHIKWRAFEMVTHILLQVAHREGLIGFDPQRKMVAHIEVAVDVRQVFVHLLVAVVMAEEAPHAGIGVTDVLEVDGAIGVAEREVLIFTTEEAFLTGKRNHIVSVDAIYFRLVNLLEILAVDTGFS